MNILELLDMDTLTLSETKIKDILPLDYVLNAGDVLSITNFQTCLDNETINLDELPEHFQLRVVNGFKRYLRTKGVNTLHPVNDNKEYLTLGIIKSGRDVILETTMSVS